MSDLVERLQSHMGQADMGEVLADCRKAADVIERLRKALEAAAVALEVYADPTGYTDGYGETLPADTEVHQGLMAKDAAAAARAALDAIKEG